MLPILNVFQEEELESMPTLCAMNDANVRSEHRRDLVCHKSSVAENTSLLNLGLRSDPPSN